jgi:hypothetical protein
MTVKYKIKTGSLNFGNPLIYLWSHQQDLNLRPSHYECDALPTEL